VVDAAFILNEVEDLSRLAWEFNAGVIFKCQRFAGDVHIYGTEHGADVTILRDLPDRISTTDIIDKIVREFGKERKPRKKCKPDKNRQPQTMKVR